MHSEVIFTDIFKQFTERNKKLFSDLGVRPDSMRFTAAIGDGSERFKHGRLLEQLTTSKTFPASIERSPINQIDTFKRQAGGESITREAVEKKMRASIIVPILLAATLYLIITLVL